MSCGRTSKHLVRHVCSVEESICAQNVLTRLVSKLEDTVFTSQTCWQLHIEVTISHVTGYYISIWERSISLSAIVLQRKRVRISRAFQPTAAALNRAMFANVTSFAKRPCWTHVPSMPSLDSARLKQDLVACTNPSGRVLFWSNLVSSDGWWSCHKASLFLFTISPYRVLACSRAYCSLFVCWFTTFETRYSHNV